MRHTRNHYHHLIRGIKKNGDLAVRRSLSNALLRDPSRDYWTKFTIQNRVDDKTGSVDIANAFADQYSAQCLSTKLFLYSTLSFCKQYPNF